MNAFLCGWAGYFRYGHSARRLSAIRQYARMCLALFISKKHRGSRNFGWYVMLNGTLFASRTALRSFGARAASSWQRRTAEKQKKPLVVNLVVKRSWFDCFIYQGLPEPQRRHATQ